MRNLFLVPLAMLALSDAARAGATDGQPCLSSPSGPAEILTLRDAKAVVGLDTGPSPTGQQTIVRYLACAVLNSPGKVSYNLTFQFVAYSKDGAQLQAGQSFNQKFTPDDPKTGSIAHAPLADTLAIGYVIDPAKLATTVTLKNVTVSACGADGKCAQEYIGTIVMDACIGTGLAPTPKACPIAAP